METLSRCFGLLNLTMSLQKIYFLDHIVGDDLGRLAFRYQHALVKREYIISIPGVVVS